MSDRVLFNYMKIVLTVSGRVRCKTADFYNKCTLKWRNSRNLSKNRVSKYSFLQWLIVYLNFLVYSSASQNSSLIFQMHSEKCVYLSFSNILHVCHQGCLSNTLSFTNLHNGSWMQLCYTISSTSESIKANCFQPCFTPPVAESVDPHISLALGKTQSSLITVPWTLHKASLSRGEGFAPPAAHDRGVLLTNCSWSTANWLEMRNLWTSSSEMEELTHSNSGFIGSQRIHSSSRRLCYFGLWSLAGLERFFLCVFVCSCSITLCVLMLCNINSLLLFEKRGLRGDLVKACTHLQGVQKSMVPESLQWCPVTQWGATAMN